MAMNQVSVPLSSRVPTELYARLRAQSHYDDIPIATHLRKAIENYLDELGTPPLHPEHPKAPAQKPQKTSPAGDNRQPETPAKSRRQQINFR